MPMAETKNKIAKILLDKGRLSQEHYQVLLTESEKIGLSPDILLETKKIIPEDEIAQAKGEIYNLPVADIYGLSVDRDVLRSIPVETAENYQVAAFDKKDGVLKVVITDPGDFKAREAVNFVGRQKNLKIDLYTAPISAIKNLIAQYTGLAVEVEEAVGAAGSRFAPVGPSVERAVSLEEISKSAPIAKLVGSILKYAVDNGASDVHIEPLLDKTRIRYRVDGVLRETAMLPGHLHSAIISRIKVMSELKLDETRIPQDGRIRVSVSQRMVDMRVSVFPLLDKEKAVMRVLDPAKRIFTLEDLGFWGSGAEIIKRNLFRPHGLLLITGPTGCGKTTTLYAAMGRINQPGVNIITLEDPVEYFLPGLNQSQVQPEIGYTFASGLRSVVRQDPDIIMVGEVRDSETAELATHAALTGHIVLSTLHTNDAFGAIPRLIDMKVEPFLVSSSLNLIVAQRLVRKICLHCKKEITLPEATEKHIEQELQGIEEIKINDFRSKDGHFKFYRGEGCSRCNNEGYRGQTSIFEVLEVTEQMQKIITSGCKIDEVKAEFKRQKMIEMIKDGYIKALRGETTVEEVLRAAKQ